MPDSQKKTEVSFDNFGLQKPLLKAIAEMGFMKPSPIQSAAIPVVLSGKDVVAQAQTGTGKTAAFGLPALHHLTPGKGIQMLVITPTRELATQVSEELYAFGKYAGLHTLTIFGGQSYTHQRKRLAAKPEVIIATPGRLMDILAKGYIPELPLKTVVLDEADEMLDMGFLEDIQKIFEYLPKQRQTLLFSATMPPPIQKLAQKILHDPEMVRVGTENGNLLNKDIEEYYCVLQEAERDDAVMRLMDSEDPEKAIIFCRTKREVDRLSSHIIARGYSAKGLHGDMEQRQRQEVIKSFQGDKLDVLVATDVAARGLDVRGVTHVFNFHLPFESESYVHRIGRTGRAGKKGIAITLVTPAEFRQLQRIAKINKSTMQHRVIPTRTELQHGRQEKIIETILEQELHPDAEVMLKKLQKRGNMEAIGERILSYLLAQMNLSGPERIGMSKQEVSGLEEQNKRQPFSRNRNQGRRNFSRPRSGGFGRGGGSGRGKPGGRSNGFRGKKR